MIEHGRTDLGKNSYNSYYPAAAHETAKGDGAREPLAGPKSNT
jgi:hypothetical protein